MLQKIDAASGGFGLFGAVIDRSIERRLNPLGKGLSAGVVEGLGPVDGLRLREAVLMDADQNRSGDAVGQVRPVPQVGHLFLPHGTGGLVVEGHVLPPCEEHLPAQEL